MSEPLKFGKSRRMRLSAEDYIKQRKALCERSDWRCEHCGRILPLQRDHIKKRSQLGGDEWENAQMLCARCHDRKDNQCK
jgi:5-methylcytosine-specific restriction endonuclease McrA